MKSIFHLALTRLAEQPAKLLYLAATLAVTVLAWVVLSAFAAPSLLTNTKTIKAELWLSNGRAQYGYFPLRHIHRIQQIPGVNDVNWFALSAFFCADGSGKTVTVTGLGGDHDDALRKNGVSEADLATWHNTENGVLVGPEIAQRCGLAANATIAPNNLFGGGDLPLHVVAVLPKQGGISDQDVMAHYDYINRLMDGPLGTSQRDQVVRATVRVKDPAQLEQIAQTIEQAFQSADPPLDVMVPGDTGSLLGRFGQVQALLWLIMSAMVMCVSLVFIAISAHLVAQRRASMAVLQTLGFTARAQFSALLLELGSIIIVGVTIGLGGGYGLLQALTPWAAETFLSGALHPAKGSLWLLVPFSFLLTALALAWPGVQMARLTPMDHRQI